MAENKHEGLVNFVLQAHGGLDLWSGLIKITARLSIAGPICAIKGWPDALVKETVEIETGMKPMTVGEWVRVHAGTFEGRTMK